MPEKSLNVLHCSLLLRQRRYRSPDNLEGQLRQFEVLRQFVQHPPAVVAGVHESALGIWKNEGFRRRVRTLMTSQRLAPASASLSPRTSSPSTAALKTTFPPTRASYRPASLTV